MESRDRIIKDTAHQMLIQCTNCKQDIHIIILSDKIEELTLTKNKEITLNYLYEALNNKFIEIYKRINIKNLKIE